MHGCLQTQTWEQKLQTAAEPHIDIARKEFAGIRAGQKMLIPSPKLIDDYIRQIPEGTSVDSITLRKDLATEYGADVTCPLTTGIFLRIVAEAAHEAFEKGKPIEEITPFWRVMNEKTPTVKKLSFGTAFLQEQRKKEHIV